MSEVVADVTISAAAAGSGAPFKTWRCQCEGVEIRMQSCIGAPVYRYGDCFCDDCNIRVRVAQDKFREAHKDRPEAVDKMNVFGPNGAVQMTGYSSATMEISKGSEHIGYYR